MEDKNTPQVSVIIPTFNRAVLAEEAILSVLSQSMGDFELIVVDDGSTDTTCEMVTDIARRDDRVRYAEISHLGYPGAVRNIGASMSQATYLAFLDSDDVWEPEKLALQLDLHRKSGAKLTHTRELWLRNGRTISQSGQKHNRAGDLFEHSLVKCIIGPSTVMIERMLFVESGGFREDLEIAEDYEFWLRLTPHLRIEYLDIPLTVKRAGHGGQLSEKYGHIEQFRIEALRNLVERGEFLRTDDDRARDRMARNELARKCRIFAQGARKRGRESEAVAYDVLARTALD